MDSDTRRSHREPAAPPPDPHRIHRLNLIGLAACALAAFLGLAATAFTTDVLVLSTARVVMCVAGLITAGAAVSLLPKDRPALLLAAATGGVAIFGFPASWDSARLVAGVLGGLALFTAVLLGLSVSVQRGVISAVVLFHFGGILTATTSPPATPWTTNQVWTWIYRPYLQFVYLNNAYHFYSPEPGPANQLWFCIEYTATAGDRPGAKSHVWFKTPKRPDDVKDPLSISYYRRLSLTEQINQLTPVGGTAPDEVKRRRGVLAQQIPLHPLIVPADLQYRVPAEHVRLFLMPGYVRYVANKFAPAAGQQISGIKVYRAEHQIVLPSDLVRGRDPFDPVWYHPYYLGEYDANGKLKDPADPMLYWMVPILREPDPSKPRGSLRRGGREGFSEVPIVKNYVLFHATGKFEEE